MRQLPAEAALSRALNDGQPPWTRTEDLIADLWALWARQEDHPRRAAMAKKARDTKKLARVIELRTVFEKRKRTYGLG